MPYQVRTDYITLESPQREICVNGDILSPISIEVCSAAKEPNRSWMTDLRKIAIDTVVTYHDGRFIQRDYGMFEPGEYKITYYEQVDEENRRDGSCFSDVGD